MCATSWETYLMDEHPEYGLNAHDRDWDRMEVLGLEPESWWSAAPDARARACRLALRWAEEHPDLVGRIVAARVWHCNGCEEIEEQLTTIADWQRHAQEAPDER